MYYYGKIKEFHELKLGQMTMEEYANKFLELLMYAKYIRNDKVKIQWFISGLPWSYRPRTLDEIMRKAKYCYDQNKSKPELRKAWKDKKNEKFD